MGSNTYLVDVGNKNCVVIDPGMDFSSIDSCIRGKYDCVKAVLCTHGHFDHIGGAARLQSKFNCPVFVHKDDERELRASNFLISVLKLPFRIELPLVEYVEGDFIYLVNNITFKYYHLPGHTKGSTLIEMGDAIFTGDSLYAEGVSLSKLPTSNADQLKKSLIENWSIFSDNKYIYPGHGKSQKMSLIKKNNKLLIEFLGLEGEKFHGLAN